MSLEKQIAGEENIQKLPENILLEILRYLPIQDRCRSRRVCKTWNRILSDNSLWRHVDLLGCLLDLRRMWKIVRTHFSPCLLTVKIRGYAHADGHKRRKASLSDPMLKELTARCPNLRLLHLNHCKTSNISLDSLPPSITCLEMVNAFWQPRWMKDKQMHLPNLERLSLDMSVRVDGYDLEDVVFWKNLKHLSLRQCYRIGTTGIQTIADHLSELEFLNICGTHIDNFAIHHITRRLKKLKDLCLSSCTSITDEALYLIAMELPMLNRLDISYCEAITLRGIESLFVSNITVLVVNRRTSLSEEEKQSLKQDHSIGILKRRKLSNPMLKELTARCPNLQLLHLYRCDTSDISLDSLPPSITCLEIVSSFWQPRWMKDKQMHLPNLERLSLDLCVCVGGYDLEDIVFWKNLKHLSLRLCCKIGTTGIQTIAAHLSELEYLNIRGTYIDNFAIHHITRHLKKLKDLCLASCTSITDEALDLIATGLPMLNRLDISYCKAITLRGIESLFVSSITVLVFKRRWTSLSEEEKQSLKQGFSEDFVLIA